MPILHVQYRGTGQDPKGKTVQLPPRVALLQQGPCIQVTIGVAKSVASQLLASGTALPKPVSGSVLIDADLTYSARNSSCPAGIYISQPLSDTLLP